MVGNDKKGRRMELVFLSREDLDILIYMTSDVWITPELKRFKNGILDGLKAEDHDD